MEEEKVYHEKKPFKEIKAKVKILEKEFNQKLVELAKESDRKVMFRTINYVSLNFKGSVYKRPIQIKVVDYQ